MAIKILILCTGNSCRSQMAEGFLKHLNSNLFVRSAGTNPAGNVNPNAIKIMAEDGIDISNARPENVDKYLTENWDYVITVCGHAKETCPVFNGFVKTRLHIGFDDPAEASGNPDYVLAVFRRVYEEIKIDFSKFVASLNNEQTSAQ